MRLRTPRLLLALVLPFTLALTLVAAGCGGGSGDNSGAGGAAAGEPANEDDQKAVAEAFAAWRLELEALDWNGAFEAMHGDLPRSEAMGALMITYTMRYPTEETPPATGAAKRAGNEVWLALTDWPIATAVTATQVDGAWKISGLDLSSSGKQLPTSGGKNVDRGRRGAEPIALYSFLRDALMANDWPAVVDCFADNSDGRRLAGLFAVLTLGPETIDYQVEETSRLGANVWLRLTGSGVLNKVELSVRRDADDTWRFSGMRDSGGRTLDGILLSLRTPAEGDGN